MKRLIMGSLSLVLLLSCSKQSSSPVVHRRYYSSYGPEVSKQTFEDQGKTGEVVEVTQEGVTVRRTFLEGVLHSSSTWTFPHTNYVDHFEEYDLGVLVSKGRNYENGTPQYEEQYGPLGVKYVRAWFEEGSPRLIEEYRDDKLVRGQYVTIDGDPESTVENASGVSVERRRDGLLVSRDQIVDGVPVAREIFYPNGMLFQLCELKNGLKNGSARVYLDSGQPLRLERWSLGVLEGDQILYENGLEVASVPYVKGIKDGIEKRFRPGTDEVVQEISWQQNIHHGPMTFRVADKTITEWYWRGTKVSQDQFQIRYNKQQAARAAMLPS